MVYNNYKMGSFNLHTIKTNRFKNIRVEICFRNNINPETIVRRTILFETLLENSANYQTKRDLILKCEELYNANLYTESYKVGNEIISTINYEFLDPKYASDLDIDAALELPFDLIFNPMINDSEFDADVVETIKLRAIAEEKALREEPRKYCIHNALKAMDNKSVSSISLLGDEKSINKVNKTNLYDEYINILEHDYIDIFIIGDIDNDTIIDIINKHQHFNTIKHHELSLYVSNKIRRKANIVKEKGNYNQAQIIYILNVSKLTKDEVSYAAHIYNHILGGGSLDTRLYQKLRGENSLCYNVASYYNKYDGLIIISTSVDSENIRIAKKLIEETINSMKVSITDDEVEKAKQAIITSINMSLDSPHQIISNYLFHEVADLDLVNERINKYEKVTKKDISNIANKVNINTIYVMESDQSE